MELISCNYISIHELLGFDPFWESHSWHLLNTGQIGAANNPVSSGIDLNVVSVWRDGFTGKGVSVLVADDGVDSSHPDLQLNLSLSKNLFDAFTNNPYHDLTKSGTGHGTSCSGIIAAKAGNDIGSRGIAPDVTLVGNNILYEPSYTLSNRLETYSSTMDIHNYSWETSLQAFFYVFGNQELVALGRTQGMLRENFENELEMITLMATTERNGKGTVFVTAMGNSYHKGESGCISLENSDPYQIQVASINGYGIKAFYSSIGSCLWVSGIGSDYFSEYSDPAFVSFTDPNRYPGIFTTDISGCSYGYAKTLSEYDIPFENGENNNHDCNFTSHFNGTSAAAPTVTGVIALMLDANNNLTVRDIKYILANTSTKVDSQSSPLNLSRSTVTYMPSFKREIGWQTNSAGYNFHHWYGFGLINAQSAVEMAKDFHPSWDSTGSMESEIFSFLSDDVIIPTENLIGVSKTLNVNSTLSFIETVRIDFSLKAMDIPDLSIDLISPSGTISKILLPLQDTQGATELNDVHVVSNTFYGENPEGIWKIQIRDAITGSYTERNLITKYTAEGETSMVNNINILRNDFTGDNTFGEASLKIYGH